MPFLKSVKMSVSSCSLSVGQMVLMKYASSTLRLRTFSGVLLMMVYLNLWVGFCFKCLAGSNFSFCLRIHFIVLQHYELSFQYNFGHKNNRPDKCVPNNIKLAFFIGEIIQLADKCFRKTFITWGKW